MSTETVKVRSWRFGEIEVTPSQIVEFAKGLPGFDDKKKYALFSLEEEAPFQWLQSMEDDTLAFVVVNPMIFMPDYSFELSDQDAEWIAASGPDDVTVLVLVTLANKPENLTANLAGPLVLNVNTRKIIQVVVPEGNYTTKHPLLQP